VDGRLSRLRY